MLSLRDEISLDSAIILHRKGLLDDAEQAYGELLSVEPGHAGALHLLGVIRQQQARHEEALGLIGRAIAVNPARAVYHNNYGAALLSLERFAQAEASLRQALSISPAYPDALANLGMAQAALGDDAAAEQSLRQALQFQAWHRDATTRLAKLLHRQRRFDEAERLLESALAAAPCPQFQLAMGLLKAAAGQVEEAGRFLRAAIFAGVPPCADTVSGAADRLVYEGSYTSPLPKRDANTPSPPAPLPEGEGRIAFVSPHCVLDPTNGAATATLDGLNLLSGIGFRCEVFCGTRLDSWSGAEIEPVLKARGERYVLRDTRIGPFHGRMIFTSHGSMPVTMADLVPGQNASIHPDGPGGPSYIALSPCPSPGGRGEPCIHREEIAAFLTGCEMFLDRFRPNLVWTYGGDPVALLVQQMARRRGIPLLFSLYNFAYEDRKAFELVDWVVVPSEFSARYYREKLGLECRVLPISVHWKEASVQSRGGGKGTVPFLLIQKSGQSPGT